MIQLDLPLNDIVVPPGRRELRGLDLIIASINDVGLINPITVTEDRRLVAGYHRLEACRRLGWPTITVTVIALPQLDTELAEIDENLVRNDLTVLERSEHLLRRKELYEARHPETRAYSPERQRRRRRQEPDEIISPGFSEDTAARIGFSQRTIQHEVQIAARLDGDVRDMLRPTPVADRKVDLLALAKMEPKRQLAVARRLAEGDTRTAREVGRALDRDTQLAAIREYRPPAGRFSLIVADPPWRYECRVDDGTHRGTIPYPSMSVEEICSLELPADDDCILWLWTTNAFLPDAFRVLTAWGFAHKTMLTWVKNRMGVGNWLRGQTEHCLLATKGHPLVHLTNQSTVLHAAVREHSRKPEEFYELVESLCPAQPRLELFARGERPGWTCAGAEVRRFTAEQAS